MRHIDFAVKCIQRALARVENDRFTPAVLSPEITEYLIDLTVKHPHDGSEFSNLVLRLPYDGIENELLRQIIPEHLRQTILENRTEHEELQIKKETEISHQRFDNAADYRDRQERIAVSIRNMIANQELTVTPKLIDATLRSLGYKGS